MSGPSNVTAPTPAPASSLTLKQDLKARLLALPREDEPLGTQRQRDTPPLSVVAQRRLLHSLLGAQCAEERSIGSSASDRFHAWSTQAAASFSYEDPYEQSSTTKSTKDYSSSPAPITHPPASFVLHSGIKFQPKRR
jgi:hypothetical protein